MARFLVAGLALAVTACNLFKGEQTDRPLPAPEPSTQGAPARPAEVTRPAPNPPQQPTAAAPTAAPTPATPNAPTPNKPGPTPSAPTSSGSATPAPAPSPAPTLTLPPVDGGLTIPTAACIQKCQGRMQTCLNQPLQFDGGVPSLDSMNACKKAFEDCRGDCS